MSTMQRKRARRALTGQGHPVKVRYLGGAEELVGFIGSRTKTVYKFGGRINLGEVDSRDLHDPSVRGLLRLHGPDGHKLFEIHVPLKEEIEAEARKQEAREAAEALAVAPEKPVQSKRKAKVKVEEPDGEGAVSGD